MPCIAIFCAVQHCNFKIFHYEEGDVPPPCTKMNLPLIVCTTLSPRH